MKKFYLLLLIALISVGSVFAKSEKQVVVFDVDLHCAGCVSKVEKNIAFEKGVKDLVCDLDHKTVTVTFDPAKTSVEALQKAFAKIGKPAVVHGCGQCPKAASGQCCEGHDHHDHAHDHDGHQHTDAKTGATTK